jgi:hypothetical protein
MLPGQHASAEAVTELRKGDAGNEGLVMGDDPVGAARDSGESLVGCPA